MAAAVIVMVLVLLCTAALGAGAVLRKKPGCGGAVAVKDKGSEAFKENVILLMREEEACSGRKIVIIGGDKGFSAQALWLEKNFERIRLVSKDMPAGQILAGEDEDEPTGTDRRRS